MASLRNLAERECKRFGAWLKERDRKQPVHDGRRMRSVSNAILYAPSGKTQAHGRNTSPRAGARKAHQELSPRFLVQTAFEIAFICPIP
jgi:hypothetical protein